ncbi:D-mannose binding lectin [Frankineae bacterium MT45]|nr:D-mannose binding lectin [Frankineae bacterium MT45]
MRRRSVHGARSSLVLLLSCTLAVLGMTAASSAGAVTPSVLSAGQTLATGGSIVSPNGAYRATIQTDGNFVVYQGSKALWSTRTTGSGATLAMQTDGNLVIYRAGKALWASHTTGTASSVDMQNDGNLVIYGSGRALWSWRTGAIAPPVPSTLTAGHTLPRGGSLLSPNHAYRATMQTDGNFVVYAGSKALWSTRTAGTSTSLAMQADGNLVIYNAGRAIWSTATAGSAATLTLQNDGNLVVSGSGRALWSWRTGRIPAPALPKPLAAAKIVYTDVSSIVVGWALQSGVTSGQVMVRRAEGTVAPASPSAGTLVGDIAATTGYAVDSNLTHNGTYSYALFPHNAGGYAAPSKVTGTTSLDWHPAGVLYSGNFNDLSCASASVCVGVDTKGSAETTTDNGETWSAPIPVDSNDGGLSAVSCGSTTFCVAVDFYGNAFTYNGTSWSSAQNIDAENPLSSISCPTTTFCQAVDYYGGVVTFDSGTWSTPTVLSDTKSFTSVSCSSDSFCAAVDDTGDATIFNGTTWSTLKNIDGTHSFNAVSCTTGLFCAAVDDAGNAITYKNTRWGTPVHVESNIRPDYQLVDVSCTSVSFCLAVDFVGAGQLSSDSFLFDGTSWADTGSSRIFATTLVSCGAPTACLVANASGSLTRYAGSEFLPWNTGAPWNVLGMSCPTTNFCMIVDHTNSVRTWSNGQLSGPIQAPTTDGLYSVSCASPTFCLAITAPYQTSAESTVYDGASWSAPVKVGSVGYPSVSCVSRTFCMATDSVQLQVRIFNGSIWTAGDSTVAGQVVSCVSSSFCVSANSISGDVSTYNGAGWSARKYITQSNLTGISCKSATFCMAVDQDGNAMRFDGASWSQPEQVTSDGSIGFQSVSCASSTFCAAVDYDGGVHSFNGIDWVTYSVVTSEPYTSALSCPSPTFCAMTDPVGNFYVGD